MIDKTLIDKSLILPSLVSLSFLRYSLLMSGALSDSACHVGVDLGVTLRSLEVNASLLGDLLVAGALPLGQPSLMIGLRPRILGVKVLGIFDVSLALFGRHEDLSAALSLLHDVLGLLLLPSLRHAVFNKAGDDVFVLILLLKLREWQLLLNLYCLCEVARVNQSVQESTLDLNIALTMSSIKPT